jgi:hypothetical protein
MYRPQLHHDPSASFARELHHEGDDVASVVDDVVAHHDVG